MTIVSHREIVSCVFENTMSINIDLFLVIQTIWTNNSTSILIFVLFPSLLSKQTPWRRAIPKNLLLLYSFSSSSILANDITVEVFSCSKQSLTVKHDERSQEFQSPQGWSVGRDFRRWSVGRDFQGRTPLSKQINIKTHHFTIQREHLPARVVVTPSFRAHKTSQRACSFTYVQLKDRSKYKRGGVFLLRKTNINERFALSIFDERHNAWVEEGFLQEKLP